MPNIIGPILIPGYAISRGANVDVFNTDGSLRATFVPFAGFAGQVVVGTGSRDGLGLTTIVASANGHVKVFDRFTGGWASGAEVRSFLAYSGFTGNVSVGGGDVNRDGAADIITGASTNGHVKVFDGRTGAEFKSFFAYPGATGGISVAAGDVNGDGFADIVTGASANGHVKVFDGQSQVPIHSFFAYPGFTGSVSAGAGDLNRDGFDDIITGASVNGHVKAFDGRTGTEFDSFFAFPGARGNVTVAGVDTNTDGTDELLVGVAGGTVNLFDGQNHSLLYSVDPLAAVSRGVFVS
ncbi:FG-GAP-like repeat-containing protein [Gemmata massiliana]|uniref:FG-GAP-like repeat-containing protein n=1 Tax=Gemmata massiliana TaxID=1210884 RepID=UPI0013A6BCB2|nr:FG-GAP-like repeat-containing protein [Gemmata massiliana]